MYTKMYLQWYWIKTVWFNSMERTRFGTWKTRRCRIFCMHFQSVPHNKNKRDFRWVTNSVIHPKSRINRKRKRKWKKISYVLLEIFQGFQNCLCFYSSIKTEGVLFFFIYIALYIYICIYIKNQALNGKMFRNKKCFILDFTFCVKISVRSDK